MFYAKQNKQNDVARILRFTTKTHRDHFVFRCAYTVATTHRQIKPLLSQMDSNECLITNAAYSNQTYYSSDVVDNY